MNKDMAETLQIRNLGKRYQKKWAIYQLSMTIHEGDLFGFIGPNGAGKSTTIKILASLESPTEGEVLLYGKDVTQDPFFIRRTIGYMPELFGLYDELLVQEYLEFFARVYQIPASRRDTLIADLMDLTDLSRLATEDVKNLSKGLRQRLYLAKTLIPDPKILLLDEPASGLDPRARVEFREILFELQKAGKTILISSHILAELQDICNRIAIIENGRLLVEGTIQEIIQQITPYLQVKIRALNRTFSDVQNLLAPFPFQNLRIEGKYLLGEFHGTVEEIPKVHRFLVEQSVDLFSFQVYEGVLEDVFMKITTGEVG